jgi:cytochrome P450
MSSQQQLVPQASVAETFGVLADVVIPLMARGVIVRRQRVVDVLDRLDADRRAVRRFQLLRKRYGRGPVLLRAPGRKFALLLAPDDVHRALGETPDPFTPANIEKRAALSRFQPHGVLISEGAERAERRRVNEEALQPERPIHSFGAEIVRKVGEEADALLEDARRAGTLTWDRFAPAWWRMVRRVVLGDAAREDHGITDTLARLRGDANWAYLAPKRRALRDEFLGRVEQYVQRAEAGSLASLVASAPPGSYPHEQVPHWLFAFDAAGMASFRALALLDAHPAEAARAREEVAAADLSVPADLPFLRACVLESVRLWPTTPAILRDTTAPTTWESGTVPGGAAVLVFVPFFHRDDERLPYADSFSPELWMGEPDRDWPLIPFSEGPGVCPGRNVVLLTTTSLLAKVVAARAPSPGISTQLASGRPLPRTLSPFRLTFDMRHSG